MSSKLYRSKNTVISGVCAGIAEYFRLDPTIVRVVWALIAIPEPFLAIIGYVVCAIVIPQKPIEGYGYNTNAENMSEANRSSDHYDTNNHNNGHKVSGTTIGLALILVGAVLIFKQFFSWISFINFWPVALILIGIYIIFKRR